MKQENPHIERTAVGPILRKGFSTGSTSAAAVKASIRYYFENKKFDLVDIKMPGGENVVLKVFSLLKFKLESKTEIIISFNKGFGRRFCRRNRRD